MNHFNLFFKCQPCVSSGARTNRGRLCAAREGCKTPLPNHLKTNQPLTKVGTRVGRLEGWRDGACTNQSRHERPFRIPSNRLASTGRHTMVGTIVGTRDGETEGLCTTCVGGTSQRDSQGPSSGSPVWGCRDGKDEREITEPSPLWAAALASSKGRPTGPASQASQAMIRISLLP
jgi:hypothetical protein